MKKKAFKYREDELLAELYRYISNTYGQHYVGEDNVQSLDLIFSSGNGRGFCVGNVLKYGARYGKKQGFNRDDVLKILHYGLLALYRHDVEHKEDAVVGRDQDSHPRAAKAKADARDSHVRRRVRRSLHKVRR